MVLLDTHILLWWSAGGSKLSARAAREIARANRVYVSPISFWEVAMLVDRGRIRLDRDPYEWALGVLEEERVDVAELTPQAAVGAALFDRRALRDPADRFLCATARNLAVPLVTKDTRVREYAIATRSFRTVW
jgi:PIN domain nuclease of toxin-antitoxin system